MIANGGMLASSSLLREENEEQFYADAQREFDPGA
jgi:hypothetical protein